MPAWTIVGREARRTARCPHTFVARAVVTAIGIGIIPFVLWQSRATPNQGPVLFVALTTCAYLYALFGGIVTASDSLAEEKRENTLGLLFLTELNAAEILIGKFIACAGSLFSGLLAFMPLLAVPLLLGGVSAGSLLSVSVCILNTLFFGSGFGFLVAALLRKYSLAIGLAAGLLFGVLAPVLIIFIIRSQPLSFVQQVLAACCPALPIVAALNSAIVFEGVLFQNHLFGWVFFLLSLQALPRFWQEEPKTLASAWLSKVGRFRFVSPGARQFLRARLLGANPVLWLSSREQVSSGGLMLLLVTVAVFSGVGGATSLFFGLLASHLIILVRLASAISPSIAEDRRSGALELLLVTSLSIREILRGRWLALGRQYFGPILIVLVEHLFVVFWFAKIEMDSARWFTILMALPVVSLAWLATGWLGMWFGLRMRDPASAIVWTIIVVLLGPAATIYGLFTLLSYLQLMPRFRFGGMLPYFTFAWFIWGTYLYLVAEWVRRRLHFSFRETAADCLRGIRPFDWRAFMSIGIRVAGLLAILLAAQLGWHQFLETRGQQDMQRVLAKYPTFKLGSRARAFVDPAHNLANWGFLDQLNHPDPGALTRAAQGNPRSIEAILVENSRYGEWIRWVDGRKASRTITQTSVAVVRSFDPIIEELHAAADVFPELRFFFHSGELLGDDASRRHVYLGNLIRHIAVRASVRLAAGEPSVDDILLGLRLANSVTNDSSSLDPFKTMISSLIQPVFDGLLERRWNRSDLKTLQSAFEALSPRGQYELERNDAINSALLVFYPGPRSRPFSVNARRSYNPGVMKSEQASFIDLAMKVAEAPFAKGAQETPDSYRIMIEHTRGQLIEIHKTYAEIQGGINQVVFACAIERFRMANNRLPNGLHELLPDFLEEIPDAAIPTYSLSGDRYILKGIAEWRLQR